MDIPESLKNEFKQLYPFHVFTLEQWYLLDLFQNFCGDFLRFIPGTLPDFSSHGIDHTLRIIKNINTFILGWNLEISSDELLLLYIAAWTHDIGCVRERENHHDVSVEIITTEESLQPLDESFTYCLSQIIIAHRKKYPIESVPEMYDGIRLQLLCAIFRIMDGCEITYKRAPIAVFKEKKKRMNAESIRVWEAHMSIREIGYKAPAILVDVTDANICADIIDDLKEEVESVQKTFERYKLEVPHVEVRVYDEY